MSEDIFDKIESEIEKYLKLKDISIKSKGHSSESWGYGLVLSVLNKLKKKDLKINMKKYIYDFLLKHKGKKFSISFIWETIAGKMDVSYNVIRERIDELYKENKINKSYPVGTNKKYVWIDKKIKEKKDE